MKVIHSLHDNCLPLKNTAVALGIFDGVHTGHMAVLGSVIEVARHKGLSPCVFTFALSQTREEVKVGAAHLATPGYMEKILDSLGMEYAVAPAFSAIKGQSPREFVKDFLHDTLGAKFICCGYNFGFGKGRQASAQDLKQIAEELGMICLVVPKVETSGNPVSSTRIREAITQGDMWRATRLLGRPFTIDFPVVQGNRIGRTLGTPTINQPFPQGFVIPRYGVYAALATVDGKVYSGVTNVGVKPTVGSDIPLAETYIQGFSGDLYGRRVEISFLEFVRPEQKFSSLEELRTNIYRDADTAAKIAESYITTTGFGPI